MSYYPPESKSPVEPLPGITPTRPLDGARTVDEIREAFLKILRVATGRSTASFMRIPADPRRDADLIVSDALDELEELRARQNDCVPAVEYQRALGQVDATRRLMDQQTGELRQLRAELTDQNLRADNAEKRLGDYRAEREAARDERDALRDLLDAARAEVGLLKLAAQGASMAAEDYRRRLSEAEAMREGFRRAVTRAEKAEAKAGISHGVRTHLVEQVRMATNCRFYDDREVVCGKCQRCLRERAEKAEAENARMREALEWASGHLRHLYGNACNFGSSDFDLGLVSAAIKELERAARATKPAPPTAHAFDANGSEVAP